MLKALSITGSHSHQSVTGRRGRGFAHGAVLAVTAFLALASGAAAASARAVDTAPSGAAVQLAGWEGHGHQFRPRLVVPRAHPHGAQHHKFHRRQTFRGHEQGHRQLHHKGRRYYGAACRPIKVVGWHRGHRALFGQVLCVNRFGQRSTLRGSRYLIRYLYH